MKRIPSEKQAPFPRKGRGALPFWRFAGFPDVSRKYADTADKFYYKDNLLGKWSTVTLSFTPVSKLLWSVGINWSGIPATARPSWQAS